MDILPDAYSKTYSSFTVALNSLTISSGSDSEGSDLLLQKTPVILDSGTTLTYLPSRVASQIYDAFGAVDDTSSSGLVYVDCDLLSSKKNTTVDFRFGSSNGPLVRVPIDEVILDNVKGYINIGLELPDLPFDDVCSFGIQSLSGIYLLGDTFLRSAYVVYDLTNKKVALAQANVNATGSNVMEITASSGIPLVSGVAAQETPTPSSNSDDANNSGTNSGSGSGSGSGSDSGSGSGTGGGSSNETPDSAAFRAIPVLQWEAAIVVLVATSFSLVGAGLFTF